MTPNTEHPTPSAQGLTPASPIADLTYRNYDGPLKTHSARFWIVSLAGIRMALKKKGFWIIAALSLIPYFIVAITMYVQSRSQSLVGGQGVNPLNIPLPGQKYSSQFFQAFPFQSFFLFILTLLVGTGSIASDNQTNALQVYLSKPITKGDYLLGKWIGIFTVLFVVALAPALFLYLYCLGSYTSEGFLKSEPWLIFRIIGACAVPAAVYSGLMVGFSAWSKTPRMAGAFFAGFYFIAQTVAAAIWGIRHMGNLQRGVLERHLSVDGAIQGLVQNIYGVTQRMLAGNRRMGGVEQLTLAPPNFWVMLALCVGLIVVGLLAARMRIRAVEVVRG